MIIKENTLSISVDPTAILEVSKVKLHLNFKLVDTTEIYDRVNDLEARIIHIENRDTNQKDIFIYFRQRSFGISDFV